MKRTLCHDVMLCFCSSVFVNGNRKIEKEPLLVVVEL